MTLRTCCFRCNNFKGDYWLTGPGAIRLWHPRHEPREDHLLELADGCRYPLTPTGALTLHLLHLNRPELITYRRNRRNAAELNRILKQLQEVTASVSQLRRQVVRLIEDQQSLWEAQRTLVRLLLGRENRPP
jgi:hypothetical protein